MKSSKRTTLSRSLVLLLVVAWSSAVSAQQAPPSLGYGFVSPNTKENLKLEQAIKGMRSPAEAQLQKKAINLSCVVRTRIQAYKALGSWNDGAEPSVMMSVKGDEDTLRYLLSRMGREAQQKYVIYFHPQPGGPVDLYKLRARNRPRNLVTLTQALERAGVPFSTLVPLKNTTVIFIIDLDRDLRDKILNAASTLRAQVSSQPGKAKLFGDDVRKQAQTVFEQDIKNYEQRNPNLPPTCGGQKIKRP